MTQSKFYRAILFSAVAALGCFSAHSARAGDMIDNPKYSVWAKFKPGSTSTVSADIDMQGNKIHIDILKTLVSVDADQVVVETKVTANVMGHDHAQPATKETIPSKTDKNEYKPTGEKEVEAMGKTFKCKVWDAKGSDPTAKPAASADPMNSMQATVYVSDEVPGGLVKLDGIGKGGKPMTFVLTAMEAK